MLDKVKALGYKYSTRGAITVSIARYDDPGARNMSSSHEAEEKVVKIDRQYKRGLITDDERYRLTVTQWEKTIKDVTDALQDNLDRFNPIFMMADSGARGSMNQIRQLAGMRGLMARYHRPAPLRSRSRQTSVKACPSWNTSFPPEAPERA